MKAAVIFLFLIACFQAKISLVSARAIETLPELEPEEEACVNELHLNKDEIRTINSQDIAPEDNPDFNRFLSCFYQKKGWQDSTSGDINWYAFKTAMEEVISGELEGESPAVKMLVKQMMLNTVTECQKNPPPKGKTYGQTVVRVQNCVVHKLNKIMEED